RVLNERRRSRHLSLVSPRPPCVPAWRVTPFVSFIATETCWPSSPLGAVCGQTVGGEKTELLRSVFSVVVFAQCLVREGFTIEMNRQQCSGDLPLLDFHNPAKARFHFLRAVDEIPAATGFDVALNVIVFPGGALVKVAKQGAGYLVLFQQIKVALF